MNTGHTDTNVNICTTGQEETNGTVTEVVTEWVTKELSDRQTKNNNNKSEDQINSARV